MTSTPSGANRTIRLWMSASFFVFFLTWSVYLSYWSVLLHARGFGYEVIGLAVTVSLVTRALTVAFVFPLVNRYVGLLRIVRVLPWFSVGASLLFLGADSTASLMVVSALLGVAYPVILPTFETVATLGAKHGRFRYGPARAMGSIGFVAGTALNGLVIEAAGDGALLWVFAGGCALLGLLSLVRFGDADIARQRTASVRGWGALFARRDVLLLLAVSLLVQASHGVYYTYAAPHLAQLGAGAAVVSLVIMCAPLAEIVVLAVAGPLLDRIGLVPSLALVCLAGVVRWTVVGATDEVWVFALVQVLHGLTFAALQLSYTSFVRERVPSDLAAPAQGANQAFGNGVATAATTALGGILFAVSPAWAFWSMGLVAALALPLLPLLARALRTDSPEPPAAGPAIAGTGPLGVG